jgi:hypothetical protein
LHFGIVCLFFVQTAGTLVESIYILDLMNTNLDEKALGVLFFFSPLLLFLFPKKRLGWMVWLFLGVLLISRGLIPYLNTTGRLIASGFGIASVLLLLPMLMTAQPRGESHTPVWSVEFRRIGAGRVPLRVFPYMESQHRHLPHAGRRMVGLGTGGLPGMVPDSIVWDAQSKPLQPTRKVVLPILGIYLALTLVYFAFSAPAVIARWTQGDYVAIILAVSLFSTGWVLLTLGKPGLLERITHKFLLLWNLVFALSLTATILAHRVTFP